MRSRRVVLDTGVIVEYINESGPYHEQAKAVFNAILRGDLEGVIPHPVLVETYYVASRLYRELGVEHVENRAQTLIEWLYRLPTIHIKGLDLELAIEAGKAKLRYGIALTDCYVLATAKICRAKALFRKREKEMIRYLNEIQKEYSIVFLEDYA